MIAIEIYKPHTNIIKEIPDKRTLLWYDNFYRKMRKLEGSYLKYNYEQEKYIQIKDQRIPAETATQEQIETYGIQEKLIIKPEAITIKNKKSIPSYNRQQILDWKKAYSEDFDVNIEEELERNNSFIFELKKEDAGRVCTSLDFVGLDYRIL